MSTTIFELQNPSAILDSHHDSHVVQFYSADAFLIDVLAQYVGGALTVRDPSVIIGTELHLETLADSLARQGIDIARQVRDGRCLLLNAEETLGRITVAGRVDRAKFVNVIGSALLQARNSNPGNGAPIAAFGELVALLWGQGRRQEAIQVEEWWNSLTQNHFFRLLCAYPLSGFNREDHIEPFLKICAQHSKVVPSESFLSLNSAEERLRTVAHLQQRSQVLDSEMSLKQNLMRELRQAKDLDDLIGMIAQKAMEVIGAEAGFAGIRHSGGLDCRTYFREGKALPFEYCFLPGQGLAGWTLVHKAPYLTNAAHLDRQILPELRDLYGIRSALAIPVLDAEGEVIAFLEIHNKKDGFEFTVKDQRLLVLISEIAAVAILQTMAHAREIELRRSEQLFRLFIEAVQDYALFTLDAEGYVRSWNKGAKRIKGYERSEIIGKHFSVFYPEEDVQWGKPSYELEVATKEGRFEDEGWRIRKDGSRFWANVIITPVKDEAGKVIAFGKVTRDFTERMKTQMALQKEIAERRKAEARLHDSEQSLRQLSVHLLRSQDEERRRIGRDLHDSLGQSLAVLKMKLDSITLPLAVPPETAADIDQCARLVEDAIAEMRTISYLLYPPMLDEMGLKSAIPWYLEGFAERSGIAATFEVDKDIRRLDRDVELALFRILQESLTNVHRHSGSQSVHIRLHMSDGRVILQVADDGKGLPERLCEQQAAGRPATPGVGLRGMNERMQQIGGTLELSTTPDGTTVTASVPIERLVEIEPSV